MRTCGFDMMMLTNVEISLKLVGLDATVTVFIVSLLIL